MDRWVEEGGNLNCRDPNPPSMKKQYLSKRKERRGRERRRRAFKFTRERLFVRSRARMGNQSTSKTSLPPFSPALPSERIHCRRELLLNLICYKTILSTALGIWAKNCPGILSLLRSVCPRDPLVLSSCPETDLGISLLLLLLCGDWPAGSAAAASESGGGRICKGFTSDLEGLRLIAS